jgi:hypothetical protein
MSPDSRDDLVLKVARPIGWFFVGYSIQTALLLWNDRDVCLIAFTVLAGPVHVAAALLSLAGVQVSRETILVLSLPSGGVVVAVLAHLLRQAIDSRGDRPPSGS